MRRNGLLIQLAVVALLLVASPNAPAQDITVTPEITPLPPILTATEGNWQPPEGATPSYQWMRCSSPSLETCGDIPGETNRTLYPVAAADAGYSIRIRLAVSWMDTQMASATSLPELIGELPSNVVPPSIEGVHREGQRLSVAHNVWRGPPLSFGHQWERCEPGGQSCTPILNAVGETYTLSAADVGKAVRVAVTAMNAGGASQPVSSAHTSIVARAPLVNTGLPSVAGIAAVGQSLTATPGGWESSGPIDFLYRWLRCRDDGSSCDPIPGADSATYQVRMLDVGLRLRARVTAIGDGGAGSETRDSAPTGVVPAPAGVLPFTQSGGPTTQARTNAFMRPFPRVRIKGYYTPSGAVVQLLTVKRAKGARIVLACRGPDCPFRKRARRGRQRVRVRSLEQSYRAGTRLTIRVAHANLIGKYARIVIRANRAPKRRDRCLMPGRRQPVSCPLPG